MIMLEVMQKPMRTNQHGHCEYGFRIKEGKRILEFCAAMTMTVVEEHTPQEVSESPCHL